MEKELIVNKYIDERKISLRILFKKIEDIVVSEQLIEWMVK